jgi:hypothetical protein
MRPNQTKIDLFDPKSLQWVGESLKWTGVKQH